jgi:beta-N-acetylhexosaminidase
MNRFPAIALSLVLVGLLAGSASAQTVREMAGQMLIIGFQGTSANDAGVDALVADIVSGRIGGVIYLKSNVTSLADVRAINARLTQAAAAAGRPPLLIALDQEGGSIERLTGEVGFDEIPSAAAVAGDGTPADAEVLYVDLARRLRAEGFNLNLGPVVDLDINPRNPIIARYGRAFGRNAETVTAYARAFIAGHRQAGVLTALKHFPGHGSSTGDSHEGFVDISASWDHEELEPYRFLIDEGMVDMVMPGHLYLDFVSATEADQPPASLSRQAVTGLLRQTLHFEGVVITDDMEMAAVLELFALEERVKRAVRAGNDILLFTNTANYRTIIAEQIGDILAAEADADPAFAARLRESYDRIMTLKARLRVPN